VVVYTERHASIWGAWSDQGRDNLSTTLGQGRDNPIVVFVKNGSFGEFRAKFGTKFHFGVVFSFS